MSKKILVCGAGGFIGSHLVTRLKKEGFWVRGVDMHYPQFSNTTANEFTLGDLRDPNTCLQVVEGIEDVYQLAADMGGMGYISGEHDAAIMHNSALINLHMAEACKTAGVHKIFFSSSACVYPEANQLDPNNPQCAEDSIYPAHPESEYGWEKIFSERLFASYARNHGIAVRIARYHNIFGPEGTWKGGREKAPAALCRKVAEVKEGGTVSVWGKGDQTRSFLYIDECIEGTRCLMDSNVDVPLNIGSEEIISINNLAKLISDIAGKNIHIQNEPGPEGVRGRNSDNTLIRALLGWEPNLSLRTGLEQTYKWIEQQVTSA